MHCLHYVNSLILSAWIPCFFHSSTHGLKLKTDFFGGVLSKLLKPNTFKGLELFECYLDIFAGLRLLWMLGLELKVAFMLNGVGREGDTGF